MYYDLLARIKNAFAARKEMVQAPFSEFDFSIAKFLQSAGYLAAVDKRVTGKKSVLEIRLKYKNHEPSLTDFRLMSKPGRRMYIGYRDMQTVKQGHGLAVISSPEGIVSNREARKKKLGGEYLFQVW